jgi:hypothetical protein
MWRGKEMNIREKGSRDYERGETRVLGKETEEIKVEKNRRIRADEERIK